MSTRRIEGLRARAERGSTEGERRAARIALEIHEAKAAEQKPEAVAVGSGMSDARRLLVWLAGLHEAEVYFAHSYVFVPADPADIRAEMIYGGRHTAAVGRDNMFGVQFHPEKSQAAGLRLLTNFLTWAP